MEKTKMRRALGGATALGAALAVAGSGLASASTESTTGSIPGSLGSSNYSHTEYGMNGWDDCPFEEILTFNEDGTARPVPQSCITFVVREGNLTLGGIDIELEPNSMMVTGGYNTQTREWKPEDGSLHASPVTVPGGALGTGSEDFGPTGITAYVEEAGTPAFDNRDLLNMNLQLPIKLRLANPLLGNNCYIGSDDDPINLHLHVDPDTMGGMQTPITGDDGNEYIGFNYPDVVASDTEFSVPGASGCGPFGSLNWAVNLRGGLPSASGNNSIELQTAYFGGSAWQIWNQSLGG